LTGRYWTYALLLFVLHCPTPTHILRLPHIWVIWFYTAHTAFATHYPTVWLFGHTRHLHVRPLYLPSYLPRTHIHMPHFLHTGSLLPRSVAPHHIAPRLRYAFLYNTFRLRVDIPVVVGWFCCAHGCTLLTRFVTRGYIPRTHTHVHHVCPLHTYTLCLPVITVATRFYICGLVYHVCATLVYTILPFTLPFYHFTHTVLVTHFTFATHTPLHCPLTALRLPLPAA